jgi:hypothetical protein
MPNRTGDVKATEVAVNEAGTQSRVQKWVNDEEAMLENVIRKTAEWLGLEDQLPEGWGVDIFQDFNVAADPNDVITLSKMESEGQITNETLLDESRRRGMLSESLDIQEEVKKLKALETERKAEERESAEREAAAAAKENDNDDPNNDDDPPADPGSDA